MKGTRRAAIALGSCACFLFVAPIAPAVAAPHGWKAEGNLEHALFGRALSSAGDVNGDGYDDVIIGAPDWTDGDDEVGAAFAYEGSAAGLAVAPAWAALGEQRSENFAGSVAGAGDVNGDGYDDVIVGASHYNAGAAYQGRAFAYFGSPTGLSSSPNWIGNSQSQGAYFGYSVSGAGDVNGDGYDDVIVGAHGYGRGKGAVFVFEGSAGGLSPTPSWVVRSPEIGYFGFSVAGAGDVNGDGYDDVIVGARDYHAREGSEGLVLAFMGSPFGLLHRPSWRIKAIPAASNLGAWVSSAGDVNGDDFDDVIACAYDFELNNRGRAFLFLGSADGLLGGPAWLSNGSQADSAFCRSASSAGDVNGDGFDDLIVGAYSFDHGQEDEGRSFLYFGSPSGPLPGPRTAESNQDTAYFGFAVSGARDVNGDGFDDVLSGAMAYDDGQVDEGVVFGCYGGPEAPSEGC